MPEPCYNCFGVGTVLSIVGIHSTETICPDCDGEGVIMSEKKQLRRKLPPNASRGQIRLATILDAIFRSNGVDMDIIYECRLEDLGDCGDAKYYEVEGMSVDFYIKQLNMAIEYQGEQHYREEGNGFYTGQVARDTRKRAYLHDIGVRLVEIPHTIGDEFTETDIRKQLGLQ
jgi:DnaJ-class molecular chaperone